MIDGVSAILARTAGDRRIINPQGRLTPSRQRHKKGGEAREVIDRNHRYLV